MILTDEIPSRSDQLVVGQYFGRSAGIRHAPLTNVTRTWQHVDRWSTRSSVGGAGDGDRTRMASLEGWKVVQLIAFKITDHEPLLRVNFARFFLLGTSRALSDRIDDPRADDLNVISLATGLTPSGEES